MLATSIRNEIEKFSMEEIRKRKEEYYYVPGRLPLNALKVEF